MGERVAHLITGHRGDVLVVAGKTTDVERVADLS